MPWCDSCSRFYNPNTVRPDGTCPACDRPVAAGGATAVREAEAVQQKAPWHFKLLVLATVVYITWRVVQMASWVIG